MPLAAFYPYRSAAAKSQYLAMYERLAAEWPGGSENRVFATSWGETFVRVDGPADGQPLVLLPGITASSLIWLQNIPGLAAECRTYTVDRPGDVGRSTCVRPFQKPPDLVAWLDELLTAMALTSRVNLCGLSYGGWISALYALRHPARLRRLVLVAPGATVQRTNPEFPLRGLLMLTRSRSLIRWVLEWFMADLARQNPARIDLSIERILTTLRCLTPRRPVGPTVFTDAELASLAPPTLFLAGEHEKIYSAPKAVERLHRVAPQIRTELLRDAGHDLTLAQPEAVNRIMLDFLR